MVALAALLTTTACGGYLKEYAPVNVASVELRIPNQQRVVALSTQQAVERASAELKLVRYSGRTVRVEVNGVFPHSDTELLDYAATVVEAEATKAGLKVQARPLMPTTRGTNGTIVYASPPAATDKPVELRLVASLDWGGADLKDERTYSAWPMAAQIGLVGLGIIGGIAVAAPDDDNLGAGLAVIGGSVVAAGVWALLHHSTRHTFTMLGRVRVTLRAIPVVDGLVLAEGVGEAENSVVIDPDSSSGFALQVAVPKDD